MGGRHPVKSGARQLYAIWALASLSIHNTDLYTDVYLVDTESSLSNLHGQIDSWMGGWASGQTDRQTSHSLLYFGTFHRGILDNVYKYPYQAVHSLHTELLTSLLNTRSPNLPPSEGTSSFLHLHPKIFNLKRIYEQLTFFPVKSNFQHCIAVFILKRLCTSGNGIDVRRTNYFKANLSFLSLIDLVINGYLQSQVYFKISLNSAAYRSS